MSTVKWLETWLSLLLKKKLGAEFGALEIAYKLNGSDDSSLLQVIDAKSRNPKAKQLVL